MIRLTKQNMGSLSISRSHSLANGFSSEFLQSTSNQISKIQTIVYETTPWQYNPSLLSFEAYEQSKYTGRNQNSEYSKNGT